MKGNNYDRTPSKSEARVLFCCGTFTIDIRHNAAIEERAGSSESFLQQKGPRRLCVSSHAVFVMLLCSGLSMDSGIAVI